MSEPAAGPRADAAAVSSSAAADPRLADGGASRPDPWFHGDDPWAQGRSSTAVPNAEEFQQFLEWKRQMEQRSSEPRHSKGTPMGKGKGKSSEFSGVSASAYFTGRSSVGSADGRRARFSGQGAPNEPPGDPNPRRPTAAASDPGNARSSVPLRRATRGGGPPDPPDDPGDGDGDGDEDSVPDFPSETSESARTSEVRNMLMKRWRDHERPKSSLGSVKIEDFYGDRSKYRSWRRVVRAQQQLYQLAEAELSMLIYLSCKKEARDVLDQMTIEEMVKTDGLRRVWQLLDEAYHETSEEYFERVEFEFTSYRRVPGQSVASYLSQIKRLKADYLREDPGTQFSDRAWAQRLLVRASLTKRERLDVFFSSGGIYSSKEIEKALRHRCQRIHEEERKVPSSFRRGPKSFRSSSSTASTAPTSASSKFRKKGFSKGSGTHVADREEGAESHEEEDDEDLEHDPQAYETYMQDREEDADEILEEDAEEDECSEDEASVTQEELKEAWAAGWRAKDQIAEKKRHRSFKPRASTEKSRAGGGADPRKQTTTCSSCGGRGHWKGDPECPKVKSGEDKPFQPKSKPKNHVNYVSTLNQMPVVHEISPGPVGDELKVHQVNFTFVVGDAKQQDKDSKKDKMPPPREPSRKGARTTPPVLECPRCEKVVQPFDRFCAACGTSLAVQSMTDNDKRSNLLLDYASGSSGEDSNLTDSFEKVGDEPTYMVPTVAAMRALHGGEQRTLSTGRSRMMCVDVAGALAVLPFLEPEAKKELLRQIRREEKLDEPVPPEIPDVARASTDDARDGGGYLHDVAVPKSEPPRLAIPKREASSRSSEATRSQAAISTGPPNADLPKAVKKKRLEEFHRQLYHERLRDQRLRPSEGSAVPTAAQRACPHPYDDLRWSSNQYGHYARCNRCNLKNVLCWHERHGSYMTSCMSSVLQAGDPPDMLPQRGTLAIADSGCKTAVGGIHWHLRLQGELQRLGIVWQTEKESEVFKFGAGEPVASECAHLYPVGIHGVNSWLRMSVVGGDAAECPGLIGPADLSRWNVTFDFGARELHAMGVVRPMLLTDTRHPGLNLLEFGDVKEFKKSPTLKRLYEQLRDNPFSFAFLTKEADDEEEEKELSDASWSEEKVNESDAMSEADSEVWDLVQDMVSLEVPLRDVVPEFPETGGAMEESDESATSHEFGTPVEDSDESSGLSEVEQHGVEASHTFWMRLGETATMSKGKKRRVRHRAREVQGAFQAQKLQSIPRAPRSPPAKPPSRPFKVLEIFTWTLAITMQAISVGWTGCEPVTLPRWNLREQDHRDEAMRYLVREEPDLLVLAWPCTRWSPLQFYGHEMTPERYEKILFGEQEDRETILTFVNDAVKFQRSRGRAHLGENPWMSRAWKESLVEEAYEGEMYGRVDMCAYGLVRPDTREPLMKPTCLAGTPQIVDHCARRCHCEKPHAPTLGSFVRKGKRYSVADFAGGYTKAFARKVIEGAEKFLESWKPSSCCTYAADDVPEERFMDVDDEVPVIDDLEDELQREEGWHEPEAPKDDERFPAVPYADETLQKLHQRLGHPSSTALMRMLRLSGAPKHMVDAAKDYRCPVCESAAPPSRPVQQKATPRPAGFNVEVHVDLKYAKNIKDETFVALSMVCAGTNKHAAVLLKTRKPSYVARKFIKHWIGAFGRPNRVVMDQGGEFEKEWLLMLENYAIHSTTTGSHAGWQHAFAERHGGLLGSTWHALVVDTNAVSREDMAVTLAAAVDAKNELVTRRGYSANMLVFGKQITYPEMLGDDEFEPVTQAQGFDVDSQMLKRSQCRQLARQILLRDDVQQKLRRALQKKPTDQSRDFLPGEIVYFYVPNPNKPRYRRDHGRWRGPAVVILQESHQKYFVSWRGRCLLLAAPNMRPASSEEAGSQKIIEGEMERLSEEFGEAAEDSKSKQYEDLTAQQQPLRDSSPGREAKKMMSGLRSIRKMMQKSSWMRQKKMLGIQDGRRKKKPKVLPLMDVAEEPEISQPRLPPIPETENVRAEDVPVPSTPMSYSPSILDSDEEFWRDVGRDEDNYAGEDDALRRQREEMQRQRDAQTSQQRRQQMLDDFPRAALRQHPERRRVLLDDFPQAALRRRASQENLEGEEVIKKMRKEFFTTVMLAVSQEELNTTRGQPSGVPQRANEWLNGAELQSLKDIFDLPITAARWHISPRCRLQKPPHGHPRHRISVLLGEVPGNALVLQETPEEVQSRPRRRSPFKWRGLTMFVRPVQAEVKHDAVPGGEAYVQDSHRVFRVPWPKERQAVWDAFIQRERKVLKACEIYLLKMKASGKEIDPRFLDELEKAEFDKSDVAEWESWIKNKVVEIIPPERARNVPRNKIFRIPLRWVRVNKSKELGQAAKLLAKSRLVVPGHADPHLGDFRTDAPTTSPISVRLLKSLAVTRRWIIYVFDVSTAFLSGNPTDREVYARAPSDGLPKTALSPSLPRF